MEIGMSFAGLVVLFGLGSGMGLPLGIPPGPEDPVLANVAPQECLIYLSWAGRAQPDPNSPNQTEQLLAEPEIRALAAEVERLVRKGMGEAMGRDDPDAAQVANEIIDLAKTIAQRPAAIFLSAAEPAGDFPDVRGAALMNLGDELGRVKSFLEQHQRTLLQDRVQPAQVGGQAWHRISLGEGLPAVFWGARGSHLIVAVGEKELQRVLEAMEGKPPEWLAAACKQCAVPRPASMVYLNVKAVLDLAWPFIPDAQAKGALETLGLRSMTHLAAVSGLDETGVVTRAVLGLQGENLGVFRLADAKPLAAGDLAAIPRDATVALAFRLDPSRAWEILFGLLEKIDPRAKQEISGGLGQVETQLGVNLAEDLVKPLGDLWCVYNSPGEGGLIATGLTAVVRVKDAARLGRAHERLVEQWSALLDDSGRQGAPRIAKSRFADHTIYSLNVPDDDFIVVPSWCLTDKELILALFPQNIKAYLSRRSGEPSLAEVPEVARPLAADPAPVKLLYVNTPEVFRTIYPIAQMALKAMCWQFERHGTQVDLAALPSAAAIGRHLRPTVMAVTRTPAGIEIVRRQTLPANPAAAPLPMAAVLFARVAAPGPRITPRSHSINNLKQIGLALHNYHDVWRSFPPAYATAKNGKPGLSWRVLILPYLEQAPLYEQFHLDEPWDSEHNKALSAQVPAVYRSPMSRAAPGKTTYLALRGDRTVITGDKGISMAKIRDGTSNTIMVVEAADESAVEWARPDDFTPDPKNPMKGLVGPRQPTVNVLFTDGSVRPLSAAISASTLEALFTRDGGEVIDYTQLDRQPAARRTTPAKVRVVPVPPPTAPAPVTPQAKALPAGPISRARDAARRAQSINNLKQIALALHNYHDTFKTFPAASHPDEQGKPRLSWRVAILPFVEEQPLYNQFRFGEPWDSEHNKRLIARMPQVYRAPNSQAGEGKTNYLGVRGPRSVFPGPGRQVSFADIVDGTSNTIMTVEASDRRAVIWTKPDDFEPDPDNPLKGLVGLQPDGFLAGLADGSVHYFSAKIDADTLRILFDRADGKAVHPDRFVIRGR